MRKILCVFLVCISISSCLFCLNISAQYQGEINAKSAILMEASSGQILYEKNAQQPLPPASVTKIMTLLLVMEAIDDGKIKIDDMVTVSEHASSMGGSQIFLKVGEQMSVNDMIKSVVVSSANDAAVALAEHIAGSEDAFVNMMNDRAKALGMNTANFENTNGLDDTSENHVCSALDIAIMSRELLKHEKILDYTTIWQDTIRDGAFTLSNTNRLIRFYNGANGLKTGSTSKAKFCISATAKRDDMQLICVIMGSPTRDIRNNEAKKLLDWGFANYGVYTYNAENIDSKEVVGGKGERLNISSEKFSCVIEKGSINKIESKIEVEEKYQAPVRIGDKIGEVTFWIGENQIGQVNLIAQNTIEKITYKEVIIRIIRSFSSII